MQEFLAEGFGQQYPWLDLVNSQQWDGFGRLTDHLLNAAWIALFLRRWEMGPKRADGLPRADLIRLRALLRGIAEKLATGGLLDTPDIAAINTALEVPVQQRVERRGLEFRRKLVPLRGGWPWIRAQIVSSLAEMLTQRQVYRLKICPNAGCRWVFYDLTKGNVRRWCNDKRCGNRDRVRRARSAAKQLRK